MEENIEDLKLKIINLELDYNRVSLLNSKILDQCSKLIDANYKLKDKVSKLEIEIKELNK